MLSCTIVAGTLICAPVAESIDFDLSTTPGSVPTSIVHEDSVIEGSGFSGIPFHEDVRSLPLYKPAVLFSPPPEDSMFAYEKMPVPVVWRETNRIQIGNGLYMTPLRLIIEMKFDSLQPMTI